MNSPARPPVADLAGVDLGTHTASYEDTAVILYALAVGASSADLGLVYERDLHTLPTFACGLGLWAVEAAGRLGSYDPKRSLHVGQRLVLRDSLPTSGTVPMTGRITGVFDKGKAALLEIEVNAPMFEATYTLFLPGHGGWGGARGPASTDSEKPAMTATTAVPTSPDLAALYRLTGDRHPVHIDPVVAEANGFTRPILHGLCTLGIAARVIAGHAGSHPADLRQLDVRLAAPVLPGDTIEIASAPGADAVRFEARVGANTVLTAGTARFEPSAAIRGPAERERARQEPNMQPVDP